VRRYWNTDIGRKFLCVDYGGEEESEIINYIMDYEFSHGIELATQRSWKSWTRWSMMI